ncbi:unnamed protein product [Lepeophtheirus salmonis]|uniref:(salmon louse) hypothetical protein n=1 Tax=Lepeophtheirus salmonis TaxID=72036 RepID=A0A7R8CGI0_LEPSM|nr:unnamed protein product [Lepeophtheirus salmonis]CAF2816492.1 unnamed protein product [Lepeophtheirus salmonis]
MGIATSNFPDDVLEYTQTEVQFAKALRIEVIDNDTEEISIFFVNDRICVICRKKCISLDSCQMCLKPCNSSVLRSNGDENEEWSKEKDGAFCRENERIFEHFKPEVVGNTVMVPIDLADCGRAEFSNIKAVVMEEDVNGTYKLGRKLGVLKSRYTGNQFTTCDKKFNSSNFVPLEKEVTLREVARMDSIGLEHRFF